MRCLANTIIGDLLGAISDLHDCRRCSPMLCLTGTIIANFPDAVFDLHNCWRLSLMRCLTDTIVGDVAQLQFHDLQDIKNWHLNADGGDLAQLRYRTYKNCYK